MRRLATAASIVVACAILAACGNYHFPGGSSAGTGTVTGQVLAVPCAPVEKVDSPCQGRPVPNLDILFTSDSSHDQVVARTASDGRYTVELADGAWSVSFKGGGIMRVIDGPNWVTVEAGGTVVANFLMDSGIRVPAEAGSSPSSP